MRCDHARGGIAAFLAFDRPDLSDEVALHLDDCASCRAAFDEATTPLVVVDAPVPADVRARVLGGLPLRTSWAPLALAAVALLAIGSVPAPAPPSGDAVDDAYAVCLVADSFPDADEVCVVDDVG